MNRYTLLCTKQSTRTYCISLCRSVTWSCRTLWPHRLQPSRFLCPWDPPGTNTRVGAHFLLQGIFPTQGPNLHLLHHRQILSCWAIGDTHRELDSISCNRLRWKRSTCLWIWMTEPPCVRLKHCKPVRLPAEKTKKAVQAWKWGCPPGPPGEAVGHVLSPPGGVRVGLLLQGFLEELSWGLMSSLMLVNLDEKKTIVPISSVVSMIFNILLTYAWSELFPWLVAGLLILSIHTFSWHIIIVADVLGSVLCSTTLIL